jgi:folate-binding protein YgfZ
VSTADEIRNARTAAAVFPLADRGLVDVRGGDRVRFLQGQLSNDVAGLDAGGARSGCHALVLTPQGRIVAEVHVLARQDALWLETDRAAVPALIARLEKYVIADDVQIADRSGDWARFGVEGPQAAELVATAAGVPMSLELAALEPEACAEWSIAGVATVVAAFGWSGETALQLLVPMAQRDGVAHALEASATKEGASVSSAAVLDVLRVEAGVPRYGAELGEQTLPAEARLVERAVSLRKGCYTGQEVVARMHSRGRVGHLLVGLSLGGDAERLPTSGTELLRDGVKTGEVTSVALSPAAGPIALGFVRAAHAEPGSRFALPDGSLATVVSLPFVPLRAAACRPVGG